MLRTKEAELIAVFGRGRVGKAFLVRNDYKHTLIFECTGVQDASLGEQLSNFSRALQQVMRSAIPNGWMQAFIYLSDFLQTKLEEQPVVIQFDEFPWLHTPRSGFLTAFGPGGTRGHHVGRN